MDGILRIDRIRPKKYSHVSGNQPGEKIFEGHPVANPGYFTLTVQ